MTSGDYVERSARGSGGIIERDGDGRGGHLMSRRGDGPVRGRTKNDRRVTDGILLDRDNVMLGRGGTGSGVELFPR